MKRSKINELLFNLNTKVHTETETKPVMNAINILKRDMAKVFGASDENGNDIHLKKTIH